MKRLFVLVPFPLGVSRAHVERRAARREQHAIDEDKGYAKHGGHLPRKRKQSAFGDVVPYRHRSTRENKERSPVEAGGGVLSWTPGKAQASKRFRTSSTSRMLDVRGRLRCSRRRRRQKGGVE
jgi:hypothetical protein